MDDRRQEPRHLFEQQLIFRTRRRGPASVGRTRDVSLGGLFVATSRWPQVDSIIFGELRLDAAAHDRVAFIAQVLRCVVARKEHKAPRGFAARFLYMSQLDRRYARALVNHRPRPASVCVEGLVETPKCSIATAQSCGRGVC